MNVAISLAEHEIEMAHRWFEERYIPEPYSGCWIWLQYSKPTGYGIACFHRKTIRAHRLAWILFRGEIPNGLHVLHSCDTPSCVNPDHLFLGTPAINKADAVAKGRTARGASNGRVKLNEGDVTEIRSLRSEGISYRKIAKRFSVDQRTIYDAVNGRNWKYLP